MIMCHGVDLFSTTVLGISWAPSVWEYLAGIGNFLNYFINSFLPVFSFLSLWSFCSIMTHLWSGPLIFWSFPWWFKSLCLNILLSWEIAQFYLVYFKELFLFFLSFFCLMDIITSGSQRLLMIMIGFSTFLYSLFPPFSSFWFSLLHFDLHLPCLESWWSLAAC